MLDEFKSSSLFKWTLEQLKEFDPSILLNLYDDGFTFENYTKEFCNDAPLSLVPYDAQDVESTLKDIEFGYISGWIPLDDMICKYVNGTILCEVRDYRVFTEIPVINKVPLKMTLATLVFNDMPNMSEQFSYRDRLEFESRVLEFMHPFLNLEPNPVQEFGVENKPLIKLIEWDIISKKRRIDTSNNRNPLTSFEKIDVVTQDVVTQRYKLEIAQRTRTDTPIRTTPFTFPDLVGAHLRGEGPEYSTSQNYVPPYASSILPARNRF
ncbi:hypothetical protein CTI12_AA058240 [Artemisia annua]|uniref:Spt20-like SEP domain-containing protein n=1 Tax=Artemisia annua TaxID=35608 RepID=A0A2U1Q9C7_ARTAN|nr:hypothetical protein CTI12_AA058240 [Artemisia annua]